MAALFISICWMPFMVPTVVNVDLLFALVIASGYNMHQDPAGDRALAGSTM